MAKAERTAGQAKERRLSALGVQRGVDTHGYMAMVVSLV